MKYYFVMVSIFFSLIGSDLILSQPVNVLWYTQPAKQWVEALPIGNGRLGAMVYGNPSREIIQLNESSVWGGQPYRNDNPSAKEALPKVR